MAITPLPPAPEPTDSTAEFNTKAFAFVASLDGFVTETNALAVEVDADKTTATGAASTATTGANTATTQAGIATTQAGIATTAASEAAGLVENYQGALASDPSLNKDGDPLVAGDWYVNTSTGLIRAYDGSQWVTSVNVTAGVTSFSGGSTGLTPSTGTQGDVVLSGTLDVDNGGTGATSLAANNVLLGNGTSALQVVAPGTSGNVLTSNGTTWASVPSSPSAMTLVSTKNASSAPVEFTELSGYETYFLTFTNVIGSTNTSGLSIRFGTGGATPSYNTSSYGYAYVSRDSSLTSSGTGSDQAIEFVFGDSFTNFSGHFYVLGFTNPSGSRTLINGQSSGGNNGLATIAFSGGRVTNLDVYTAIRITMVSGTLSSGTFNLYGIT